MKRLFISVIALLALLISGAANAAPAEKVDICHLDKESGIFKVINISTEGNAQVAHFKNHGDTFTGTWYVDADGDGYGDPNMETDRCPQPGLVDNGDDCNDADAAINPGAEEICDDEIDNNCSGEADEGCGGVQLTPEAWAEFAAYQKSNYPGGLWFVKSVMNMCLDSTTLAITNRPDLFVFPKWWSVGEEPFLEGMTTQADIVARTYEALSDPACDESVYESPSASCFTTQEAGGTDRPISYTEGTGAGHIFLHRWFASTSMFTNDTDTPVPAGANKMFNGTLRSWYEVFCGYNGSTDADEDKAIELYNSPNHFHVCYKCSPATGILWNFIDSYDQEIRYYPFRIY